MVPQLVWAEKGGCGVVLKLNVVLLNEDCYVAILLRLPFTTSPPLFLKRAVNHTLQYIRKLVAFEMIIVLTQE